MFDDLQMKYTVGHPAYSGANSLAKFNTLEDVYVELLERGVPENEARAVKLQLRHGITYVTVWTAKQHDAIEVKAYVEKA